jgi:hypothetical protein
MQCRQPDREKACTVAFAAGYRNNLLEIEGNVGRNIAKLSAEKGGQ